MILEVTLRGSLTLYDYYISNESVFLSTWAKTYRKKTRNT